MKQITLLSLLILVCSCSSDESSTDNTSIHLVKEIITSGSNSSTRNYIYENNLLTKITGNDNSSNVDDQNYIYSGGQLSKIKLFLRQNFDEPARPVTITLSYAGENIASYITSYDDNSLPSITYTNFYINQNLDYQTTSTGEEGFHHTYYTNGNLHEIKTGNSVFATYSQYDDKKNPYSSVYPEPYLRMQIYSPNNALEVTGGLSETCQYEYSSEGYPTKKIVLSNGTVQTTTDYIYN